ncbi:hypothetical protein EDC04DRAFT_2901761 [Pisolithus marmoratus]|nr:hypothetical protein EDC04DRAFT_2901761 [Pisolithus marmoratus]
MGAGEHVKHPPNICTKTDNPLSSLSPPSASTGNSGPDEFELIHASEVYALLMYVPHEYFTQTSPTELVKRAIKW